MDNLECIEPELEPEPAPALDPNVIRKNVLREIKDICKTGSSRRVIRLPSFNVHTLMDNPRLIKQRGVHEPHQSGHQENTVSRWYINIFRTAFERAGMNLDIIHKLEASLESDVAVKRDCIKHM